MLADGRIRSFRWRVLSWPDGWVMALVSRGVGESPRNRIPGVVEPPCHAEDCPQTGENGLFQAAPAN
jgi:hypothetical protein